MAKVKKEEVFKDRARPESDHKSKERKLCYNALANHEGFL